jgi:hypothetical protein
MNDKIGKFINNYKKCKGDYYFKYLDEAIFFLCKKYPDHFDVDQVGSKVTLINRSYRANIQTSKKGAEWELAKCLVENKFDETISPLETIIAFNGNTFSDIVAIHGKFTQLVKRTLKIQANSFCSKYLYFHFPNIIPIFDSRAYKSSRELVGNDIETGYDHLANNDYAYFCAAILRLIESLKVNGVQNPNLKIIDFVLYDTMFT